MDSSNRKRAILGIILVVIGSIFLLDNLGFRIDLPWYIFRWPIVFIIIGVVNVFSGNLRPALLFFGLGIFFYLNLFDVIDIRDYWPVILIIIGLTFIFRKSTFIKASENDEDVFDEVAIFGGTDKKFTSENLKGGKITSVFGGSNIDLRGSKIQGEANIEVFCMFGGVEILVPADWKVNMDATAILGGSSDERANINEENVATLNVKGFVMFGGAELKN